MLESGDLPGKKDLWDKSIEQNEIKEQHVKLVPGWRKHEILSWRNEMCLQDC